MKKSMKREVIITADGSATIYLPDWDEQYHSKHGAIQEAYHVFIKSGFRQVKKQEINILEIGLGTGLNCFITYLEHTCKVNYIGIEAYPINEDEVQKMNYVTQLNAEKERAIFDKIHHLSWNEKHFLSDDFSLQKRQQFFQDIDDENAFDLVYFDAFGAKVQPELWTEDIFRKMYKAMKTNGILVTYCAKGSVRRAMEASGFIVERLPGPPGKREMLRGVKPNA